MKNSAVAAVALLVLTGCVTIDLPEIPPYHPAHANAESGAVAPPPPILDLSTAPPTAAPRLPVPGTSDLEPGTIRSDLMGNMPMTGNIHQEHGMMQNMGHGDTGGQAQGGMQHQGQMPMQGEAQQKHTGHEDHSMQPRAEPGQVAVQGQTHPGHKMYEPKPASGGADDSIVYTCPMHPEVVSKLPGSCPKCGMVLHKKEGHR